MSALAVVTKPADQSTDDLDLVAAVRAGDDRAFELLFLRYQSRIAAYVRGMVRDHGRAEDITQEVFMSALRRMRETDAPIAFKPWIYEIAKNACIDAFRRSRNVNEVSFDGADGVGPTMVDRGGAPDALVDTKLAIDNLCGAFGGLSSTHHDILVMREFEGLTYREIGERLGMSRAAVESTLFRARRRLSEEYEELVSGERCLRVQRIVDAPAGRTIGARDQRRMARHIAHCQPCRRYARLAGMDLDRVRTRSAATRIAALLPLPTFLRRRFELEDANQLLGQHTAPALHWSTKVVAVIDPATVSTWPKAIATAATVAVAGLGAGAAVGERATLRDLVSKAPAIGAPAPASVSGSSDRERVLRVEAPRSSSGSSAAPESATGATPAAAGEPAGSTDGASQVPGSPAADSERPAASPLPGVKPDAAPAAAPTGGTAAKDIGATLPDTSLPGVDAPLGDVTSERPARRNPVGRLVEGLGNAISGGVGTAGSDPIGAIVGTVTGVLTQGGAATDTAADEAEDSGATDVTGGTGATGSATTAAGGTATSTTSRPLSTAVGQTLGGGGSGQR